MVDLEQVIATCERCLALMDAPPQYRPIMKREFYETVLGLTETKGKEKTNVPTGMKIRTNIYLRRDQSKKLKRLSRKSGSSSAELIRRAIDKFLRFYITDRRDP